MLAYLTYGLLTLLVFVGFSLLHWDPRDGLWDAQAPKLSNPEQDVMYMAIIVFAWPAMAALLVAFLVFGPRNRS